MEFRVMGPVEVNAGGLSLPLGRPQQRLLLAILLAEAGRPVTGESLIDWMWDEAPGGARRTLQVHVARLRRLLERVGDVALVRRAGGYVIDLPPERVDLHRFRQLVEQSRRPERSVADQVVLLREAVGLWHGEPLAGLPGPWAARTRDAWSHERLNAVVAWARAEVLAGSPAEVIGPLITLAGEHPLSESVAVALIHAMHAAGRTADALDWYTRVRQGLAEELGIDPGPELQRLHMAILRGDGDSRALRATAVAVPPATAATPWVTSCLLPMDIGDFVGRAGVIEDLLGVLVDDGSVAIATVSGPPGVGKSALAIRVAHRLRSVHVDGQWYVRLGGTGSGRRDPGEVLAELLRLSGLDSGAMPRGLEARAAAFRARLADRRVLLVLDDAASAEQIRPLLPGTGGSAVLVTSRTELSGLAVSHGGRGFRLDRLTPDEARKLLAGVAGEQHTAAEPEATAELAHLCGRLPLALRIAAANLAARPSRSISVYVTELRSGDRLAKLAVEGDGQSAVRASFDLSYLALPDPLRRLFRLLGLIQGPDFTADAAAALLGARVEEVRPLLDRLVAANLVQPDTADRYRLHDLLRLYAAEHAAADPDGGAAWQRLCIWYLRTCDAASEFGFAGCGPPRPRIAMFTGETDARAWLDAEWPNLVAAAQHAVGSGPHHLGWQIADSLRGYLFNCHTLSAHRSLYRRALAAAESADDRLGQAAMWHSLGLLCLGRGDLPGSIPPYEKALRLYRDARHPTGEQAMLINLAMASEWMGRSVRARQMFQQAMALSPEGREQVEAGLDLAGLAQVSTSLGQLGLAIDYATRGIALGRRHHRVRDVVEGLSARANALRLCGRHPDALADLDLALRMCQEHRLRRNEVIVHNGLAQVHLAVSGADTARAHAQTALALAVDLPDQYSRAHALDTLGDTHLAGDDPRAATALHHRAARIARDYGYQGLMAATGISLAQSTQRCGAPEPAIAHATKALTIARNLGHRITECRALTTLSRLYAETARPHEAAHCAEQAAAIRDRTGFHL